MLAQTGDSLNFVGSLKVPDQVIIERIAGEPQAYVLVDARLLTGGVLADRYIHLASGRTYNVKKNRFSPRDHRHTGLTNLLHLTSRDSTRQRWPARTM